MRIIEFALKIIAWLAIVVSPLIFGLIIGALIYLSKQDTLGLILACAVVLVSLILGIILATRIWKKQGTINFIARIRATPELDNLDSDNGSNKSERSK